MDHNAHDDTPQQPSIVYCPSCGASAALPLVPPANTGLFCDICTSPHLLYSTNEGVDWNPLSDAFNALSINGNNESAAPQVENSNEIVSLPSSSVPPAVADTTIDNESIPLPSIHDEMKRRSLILSELMNYRDALMQSQPLPENDDGSIPHAENSGVIPSDGSDEQLAEMSNMEQTLQGLLNLRNTGGLFLMDEVDTLGLGNMSLDDGNASGMGMGMDMGLGMGANNYYQNGIYLPNGGHSMEEEGMFDDPPSEYVAANPPVHEDTPLVHNMAPNGSYANGGAARSVTHTAAPEVDVDDDDDDDEGQVYATPEQRDEMRARRKELKMNKEAVEMESMWRRYGVGGLGVSGGG